MAQKLNKNEILRGRNVFKELYSRGHRFEGDTLRAMVRLDRGSADGSIMIGIAMTRRVGNATVRNRVKRLVRESFRKNRDDYRAQVHDASRAVQVVFMLNPKTLGMVHPPSISIADVQKDMNAVFTMIQQGRFR